MFCVDFAAFDSVDGLPGFLAATVFHIESCITVSSGSWLSWESSLGRLDPVSSIAAVVCCPPRPGDPCRELALVLVEVKENKELAVDDPWEDRVLGRNLVGRWVYAIRALFTWLILSGHSRAHAVCLASGFLHTAQLCFVLSFFHWQSWVSWAPELQNPHFLGFPQNLAMWLYPWHLRHCVARQSPVNGSQSWSW
jgi:hypothetical protein